MNESLETNQAAGPRHMPWPKAVIFLVGLAGAILSLSLMKNVASIIAPTFLALNLLITAYPVLAILRKWKVPAILASLVAGLVVFALLGLMVWALTWSMTAMVKELSHNTSQFERLYYKSVKALSKLGFDSSMLSEQLKSISPSSVINVTGQILNNASYVMSMIIVIVVMLIFMIMDQSDIKERLDLMGQDRPNAKLALVAFAAGVRKYWLVTTVFGLIVAVLDWIALVILGVPLAFTWGVVAFITNYIPNIGFFIGVIPPALLALVDKGPLTALLVVIIYSVLNFVIQTVIQPRFSGDAVGLTPTLSFLSLLLWAWVFGPLGALIALPASLFVKAIFIDADPNARWVNALISSRPDFSLVDEVKKEASEKDEKAASTA